MTIEQLGNIGEFVAAVATLITLIYLAVQIRQNSRTIRVAAYRSVNESANHILAAMAEGPPAADTFAKGLADIRSLNPSEAFQFTTLIVALFNHFQTSFYQHRDGLLPDDVWLRQRGVATWWLSHRGIRSAMKLIGPGFDPAFLRAVSPSTSEADAAEASPAA